MALDGAPQHGPLTSHPGPSGPLDPENPGRPARVALVTCAALPDLDPDDHLLRGALIARGVSAEAAVWDAPGINWSSYELVVLRSPWDYPTRHREFVDWAARVPRLANPADVVAWNTDKRYLGDLTAAGVAVVPTVWVSPGQTWSAPTAGQYVVKPTVSAGSRDTGRYDLADPGERALANAHVARLTRAGRTAMVQPYLVAVDTAGETALLCLPDTRGELTFSHAIRKGPMLDGPDPAQPDPAQPDPAAGELYRAEDITARAPSAAELAFAAQVLAAVPGGSRRLLYARVDVIPGADGQPVLLELELTEPSLFLAYSDGAADRLAAAILARL